MRPSLLKATLKSAIQIRRPVLIEGAPGLGKTQIPGQVAQELGIPERVIHAPLMQPEDYGMPVVNAARDGVTFVVPAEKFPIEGSDCEDEGVLVIDELPQADAAGQKILANLIQAREIHGKRLKPGWSIVATGNGQQHRAGANRLLSHLRHRMTTIQFEPHLDDWCAWALDNEVNIGVISFLRFRPGLLADFDPQREISPTPRGWVEGVSAIMDKVPAESEFEMIKGAVGEGAAAEFMGYLKILRKLPDPDAILLDPKKAPVPEDPATRYAIAGAVAARATEKNFDRVVTYAKRLPPEFMVLVIRDAVAGDNNILKTRAFIEWASKEGAKVVI